jgi:ribonuclease J
MANRDHPVRIEAGDTVILASSLIPGNEDAVFKVVNGLIRWGANVVHKGNANVHVSGHAPAGELLYLLNAVRPSNVMPVHGEWRHLRAHAELAKLTGVPENRIVLAEDGTVVDLVDGVASVVGRVPAGMVFVDGLTVGEIGAASLKDRRILRDEGFISDEPGVFEPVIPLIEQALLDAAGSGGIEIHQLAQVVRRVVGKWVSDNFRRRPMIIPTVVEV